MEYDIICGMKNLLGKIKAFTLAEMLIVLTIAAVLMAMTAPLITKKAKKPSNTPGGGVATPVGTIVVFGGKGEVPIGWVECDGRKITEKKYARLRHALDDADYVPDMSGTYLMGMSDEPPEDSGQNMDQLKELVKQHPEMTALLDSMEQNNKKGKKGEKRYPKPILVRWIIKAEP